MDVIPRTLIIIDILTEKREREREELFDYCYGLWYASSSHARI